MRAGIPLGVVLAATVGIAVASGPPQTYYFAVDVPTRLGATDYTTNQIVGRASSAYALQSALPAGTEISALELRASDGAWLFAPFDPVTIGMTTYTPRDIVAWNGMTFGMALDGSAAGIPSDARIDALAIDGTGSLQLSFDAPVRLGATDFGRSDLVLYAAGTYSLAWSASAATVPAYANLVGASRDAGGALVLAFDVPVNLSGSDYLPGDLARWASPGGFSLAAHDGTWPQDSELRDFSYAPAMGGVPDGTVLGPPLTLSRAGAILTLAWGAACGATGATDYAVYEGAIGAWYSHAPRSCSTSGQLQNQFAAPAGSKYYLVVGRNGSREGSYGRASGGVEIPPGGSACLPQEIALSCP